MSNNKQSSVEWLVEKLGKYNEEMIFLYQNEIQEAKAMHKEEQIDSLIEGMYKGQEVYFSEHKIKLDGNSSVFCAAIAEQYYNTTFGGENE